MLLFLETETKKAKKKKEMVFRNEEKKNPWWIYIWIEYRVYDNVAMYMHNVIGI